MYTISLSTPVSFISSDEISCYPVTSNTNLYNKLDSIINTDDIAQYLNLNNLSSAKIYVVGNHLQLDCIYTQKINQKITKELISAFSSQLSNGWGHHIESNAVCTENHNVEKFCDECEGYGTDDDGELCTECGGRCQVESDEQIEFYTVFKYNDINVL